jgi:hypothetical protein
MVSQAFFLAMLPAVDEETSIPWSFEIVSQSHALRLLRIRRPRTNAATEMQTELKSKAVVQAAFDG